ncbi:MAG: methionyl-tRNA formyltransferase [Muribaculaceae bacterium]|nr:methionyl-tRNA formyltransferase [Muribaculaceae bacterium]
MEKKPKIVFFGTPEFAVTSLDRLVKEGADIAAVVTMPDKPAGRGHKMLHSAVKTYALEHALPLLQPVKLKDPEFVKALRAIGADLFIVIAFRMLPEVVWTMPPLGTFNLHASLLPRYRGAAPINRAVMNGDKETGVTTFFLKHEIDTGDIIRQEKIEIGPDEDAGSVHDRLMELGAELTADTVAHITAGDLKPMPQEQLEDIYEPCPAPKIFKETCRIEWGASAAELHNFVRGLAPYPAAWTELVVEGSSPATEPLTTLKIIKARVSKEASSLAPGQVEILDNSRIFVGTGSDNEALELLELQPSGKRAMTAESFLRGFRFSDESLSMR